MKPFTDTRDWAVTQAAAAAVLFMLIPLANAMGPSSSKLMSVLHGTAAFITVLLACQALHRTYPMLREKEGAARRLEHILWLTNALVLATIVFGNWLYISYRLPDQAQQWLLFNNPAAHMVMMEFKEFVSLFPLPLGIGAAVILRRFRGRMNPAIGSIVALLVTFLWICMLIGLVFGLILAKLKMV